MMQMTNVRGAFMEAERAFMEMKFYDKIKFTQVSRSITDGYIHPIRFDGYVAMKRDFALIGSGGEHYVYLWKHMDGDIFYVGQGKGERCKNKNRKDDFLKHIDRGDAVLYIILDKVDEKTARFYERYISGSLGMAGYNLANKDNNVGKMGKEKFDEWLSLNKSDLDNETTRKLENIVLCDVMGDTKFNLDHIRAINHFRKTYGDDYFSSGSFRNYVAEVG